MSWQNILLFVQGAGILGLLTAILLHWREMPKARAEARLRAAEADKVEAEADGLVLAGLAQEVGRLQERVKQADEQIKLLREDIDTRITHEAKLEQENRSLRQKVGRMEKRIVGLERIFALHPVTPEMQAEIDKLIQEDLDA